MQKTMLQVYDEDCRLSAARWVARRSLIQACRQFVAEFDDDNIPKGTPKEMRKAMRALAKAMREMDRLEIDGT